MRRSLLLSIAFLYAPTVRGQSPTPPGRLSVHWEELSAPEFREAIGRYYEAGGVYPRALSDLLEDKRVPVPRRFLRRLYPDPISGSTDWNLETMVDGGIIGVASSSQQKPIKIAGFAPVNKTFEKAECYCAWKFIYLGKPVGRPRILLPTPSLIPTTPQSN